jgi:hypothetical protein
MDANGITVDCPGRFETILPLRKAAAVSQNQ